VSGERGIQNARISVYKHIVSVERPYPTHTTRTTPHDEASSEARATPVPRHQETPVHPECTGLHHGRGAHTTAARPRRTYREINKTARRVACSVFVGCVETEVSFVINNCSTSKSILFETRKRIQNGIPPKFIPAINGEHRDIALRHGRSAEPHLVLHRRFICTCVLAQQASPCRVFPPSCTARIVHTRVECYYI